MAHDPLRRSDPSTQEQPLEHIVSVPMYLLIYALLLVLLVATIAASGLGLGWWGQGLALLIAATKAMLVLLFFMHVKYSPKIIWIFAGAGVVWLVILIALTFSDYLSRGWLPKVTAPW